MVGRMEAGGGGDAYRFDSCVFDCCVDAYDLYIPVYLIVVWMAGGGGENGFVGCVFDCCVDV